MVPEHSNQPLISEAEQSNCRCALVQSSDALHCGPHTKLFIHSWPAEVHTSPVAHLLRSAEDMVEKCQRSCGSCAHYQGEWFAELGPSSGKAALSHSVQTVLGTNWATRQVGQSFSNRQCSLLLLR